jgi:20S proteasome alpha/beta subunit
MLPDFDLSDDQAARWRETVRSFSFVFPTASGDPAATVPHSGPDLALSTTATTTIAPAAAVAADPAQHVGAQPEPDASPAATSWATATEPGNSMPARQSAQADHAHMSASDWIVISTDHDSQVGNTQVSDATAQQEATQTAFVGRGSNLSIGLHADQHISATQAELPHLEVAAWQAVPAVNLISPAASAVPFATAPVVHAGTIGTSVQLQAVDGASDTAANAASATSDSADLMTDGGAMTSAVSSAGATAAQVQLALGSSGLTGAGIKIGVLSDSFNNLGGAAADEANGALPTAGAIQILKDLPSGGSDEGRAMMQIIHDIAPGAGLAFYTAFQSEQDFANGILALANAGCKVIVDDVSYFDEPFFQSGIVAKAIQTVQAMGVTYVTSAGNNGSSAYQAAWTPISGTYGGWLLPNAESFGGSLVQNITVTASPSTPVQLLLEWDQAYGQDTSDLELVIFRNGSLYAIQGMSQVANPYVRYQFTASGTYQIAIENLSGTNPGIIKEIVAGNGLPVTLSGANVGTVFGHAMTPGAITAAAVNSAYTPAFGYTPVAESFSSSGAGTQLLFANDGTRISSPISFNPVTVAGVDNIATTVAGGLADFYGTSASAASLAGVAALILAANPGLTSAEVGEMMQQTALTMANPAVSGAGLVRAGLAVAAAPLFANVAIEALGSISLAQAGVAYMLGAVGGGTTAQLKFGGANVIVGQIYGWSPIAAEASGSGYEVAFKMQGQDLYTVWNTNSSGSYTGNVISTVSGSDAAFETLETSFHQDLNGDGIIGIYTNTIESTGATSLVQVSTIYSLNPVGGGTGPTLKFGGAVVIAGSLSGWAPIATEAVGGGYEVAFKMQGQDIYTVWNTDTGGNYVSNAVGTVSGSNAALEAAETSLHQDLNGDGIIGVYSTPIESNGATSLVQGSDNYFLNPVGGGTGPILAFGGTAVIAGSLSGWAPIAAEAIGGGYEVAFKMQGQDLYTVWNTDSSGNYVGNAVASVSGSNAALEAAETSFHQDLNGDGVIGIPTSTIESNGVTSLIQVSNNYFLDPTGGSTGPTLKFGGTAVIAGSLSGWIPIATEAVGGGYQVAFKMQGQDLYTVWNTDSNGNYTGNATSAVAGSSAALEAAETSLHQDLNGDGTIGVTPGSSSVASNQAVTPQAMSSTSFDGATTAQLASVGSYAQDNFHFADISHGGTLAFAAANSLNGSGQTGLVFAGLHDGFVFAANSGQISHSDFSPATDNIFSKNMFASDQALSDAIHHASDGNAVLTGVAHDTMTLQHITAAELLAHLTDFHIV